MSFFNPNALRMLLEHETQADAPVNEETESQVRENIEALLMLMAYTGTTGTLSTDPANDTTGLLYCAGLTFLQDEHNGRSLVMTSGAAKGNIYPITDTPAVPTYHYLRCDGHNLYADGIRAGDRFMVFYDLANLQAHTHDGVDSAGIEAPQALAGNYVEHTASLSNLPGSGDTGPSGYTYERKLALKLGRGGTYRVMVSHTTSLAGTRRAAIARNGVAVGSLLDWTAPGGSQTYDFPTQEISGWQTGDLLEFYIDTNANAGTWSFMLLTDNPSYDPKPLLSSEL